MGRFFEAGCCIYPAAPLITPNLIQSCFDVFQEGNWDTVFPAIEYSHPIDRAFIVNKQGAIEMINDQNKFKRTQDLKKSFHDSGQLYWFNTSKLVLNKTLFTKKTSILKVSEIETQDIDNLDDLNLAKIKYKYKLNGN